MVFACLIQILVRKLWLIPQLINLHNPDEPLKTVHLWTEQYSSWRRKLWLTSWSYAVGQQENVLDRYHRYRASKTALGFNRETMKMVKRMRQHGLPAVIDELNQAQKNARGNRKERLTDYIQYLESNQDALKDVQLSENGRPLSLGGIEGNVDKLVARRMKGRGRSWRIPGAWAMVTLCRCRPQLRDLTLKLTRQPDQPSAPKRKKPITYGSWLQCSLPFFSGSYQNQPWAKALRRKYMIDEFSLWITCKYGIS